MIKESDSDNTWISGPITLVTDRDPDAVLDAFALLQTLDTEIVTNPVGDKTVIHIKVEEPKLIPPAEVFALKTFVVETFESLGTVKEERTAASVLNKFDIVTNKKRQCPFGVSEQNQCSESNVSSPRSKTDENTISSPSSSSSSSSSSSGLFQVAKKVAKK